MTQKGRQKKECRQKEFARNRMIYIAIGGLLLTLICAKVYAGEEALKRYIPVTVTVQSGDTLWKYAKENCSRNISIRQYMDEVKEMNEMDHTFLRAGERITVLVRSERSDD